MNINKEQCPYCNTEIPSIRCTKEVLEWHLGEHKNKENYDNISHTHCWNNKKNPCGIPFEKHTQCCLCDMKYLNSNWREGFINKIQDRLEKETMGGLTRSEFVRMKEAHREQIKDAVDKAVKERGKKIVEHFQQRRSIDIAEIMDYLNLN